MVSFTLWISIVLFRKVLCALTPDCIAPAGHQVDCIFLGEYSNIKLIRLVLGPERYIIYRNCHRYDQSLFNALTALHLFGLENYAYQFNYTNFKNPPRSQWGVKRIVEARKARYFSIHKMVEVNREDVRSEPLNMSCTVEEELLINSR
jgi:hypothetical protein